MAYSDVRQRVFRIPGSIVLSVGLSWDFVGADPVDLDLSAVCFTKEGRFLDVVFFNHLFPEGTDEATLRAHFMVDPHLLPYLFLSGDSTVGGEEENQLPGLALAARRRQRQLSRRAEGHHQQHSGNGGGLATRDYTNAGSNIFNRLYEEEQLADVQMAVDEAMGYDIADDEAGEGREGGNDEADGEGSRRRRRRHWQHRELSDEVLTFVMAKIPRETDAIFLTVSSYSGQDFTLLSRAKLVLYNESTNERVGVMDLRSSTENGTANLAAMLVRVPDSKEDSSNHHHHNSINDDGGFTSAGGEWDLRELNVRTFGYTFVDLLPLVFDVLGVPANSRMDALQNLPDYSLSKVKSELAAWTLSDVRFGVGWSGEHDVDAFLVLLDEDNNYVDHLYPKNGKLRSMARDLARHSGDALCGSSATGDEEFIDLFTYRVPENVGSIVIGANWMESFGPARHTCHSIFDVPDLYLRLQNRTMMNPYSTELDRWPVYREAHDPKVQKQLPTTYTDASTQKTQPVRTVVLGALLKTGTQPFDALFPNRRRLDQYFYKHGRSAAPHTTAAASSVDGRGPSRGTSVTSRANVSEFEAGRDEAVPLFQLVPIHQYVPVDPREGFSRVIPYLQCMMAYAMTVERDTIAAARRRAAAEDVQREHTQHVDDADSDNHNGDTAVNTAGSTSESRFVLNRGNNMVGWAPTTGRTVRRSAHAEATLEALQERAEDDQVAAGALRDRYGRMWREMQHYDNRTDLFAIAVQFLEVVEVHPQMPSRFQCHGEVWVFGQTNSVVSVNGSVSAFDNTPYRSPALLDRTKLVWSDTSSAKSTAGCGYFVVHKYDRLRVMLFETASIGVADLDLMSMEALWAGEDRHDGSLSDRFNTVECNVRLDGGADIGTTAYSGELRLRVSRVPVNAAMKRLQRQADKVNEKRERVRESQRHSDERHYNSTYNSCATM
ncbi:hypothetical protein ABB37_09148 [Leptomonas pyrrhocoris]|uniref:TerD domain-containing protein n=1 Tax=Leptomonas pyrrhocoris TaxID=157538 RepID=A0A0N0DRI0_LEPPY|nr:hypothetical protein ABB37_09148 [Leptomonas pyrrhocoris]XP_015652912.1 hypothetical protein ABB37_09148 [Leptomonas pyrrhocoris]KPA74472.1 hypothetical protein ABB37_09148 [Leptomonas pyrrhocoris]KPA74473.1 hypothetical protein ABB37_09148 [Leptomonas pyrrhocoris]|eukprot:XP_015652911.1 hypothetical protein ABB37_09148 [Leptomonas pyrrhocoris]